LKSFGFCFFVGDVIMGVGLCNFGRGHQALGVKTKSQFFDLSFSWKLGYHPSL